MSISSCCRFHLQSTTACAFVHLSYPAQSSDNNQRMRSPKPYDTPHTHRLFIGTYCNYIQHVEYPSISLSVLYSSGQLFSVIFCVRDTNALCRNVEDVIVRHEFLDVSGLGISFGLGLFWAMGKSLSFFWKAV